MVVQPLLDGRRIAIGQKVDDITPLQVHNDRAVALTLAPRPVVDTNESGWRRRPAFELLHAPEKRVRTCRDGQANGQTGAGLAAKGSPDCFMGLAESIGGTAIRTSKSQQALGKDPSWTLGICAKETSDYDCDPNGLAEARK